MKDFKGYKASYGVDGDKYTLSKGDEEIRIHNVDGMCVVTGPFGNWIFNKEFSPGCDNMINSLYPDTSFSEQFSSEKTIAELEDQLLGWEYSGSTNEFYLKGAGYLEECINYAQSSMGLYMSYAYSQSPEFWDNSTIPLVMEIKPDLQVVLEAMFELSNRCGYDR